VSINSAASTAANKRYRLTGSRPVNRLPRLIARLGTGLALVSLVCPPVNAAGTESSVGCVSAASESITIRHVHDGDTVVRADGERIRLIGIDTPELAREQRPPDPKAAEARDHLRRLVREATTISARYGPERRDNYDRLLAHLYVDNRNAQAELLRAGLATPLLIAPNLTHADCYQQAAAAARTAGRGIWALPQYQPRPAGSLTGRERGYHIVTGTVQRVGQSRCCIWLNLDDDFALRIERRHLSLFNDYDPAQLMNTRLQARGYINRRNDELRMSIRHPADLEAGRDEQ